MKPLVLHEIAEAVEMHESTISRATTNKYMHTPRGIFELKYFFSSHVSTTAGGECSSTAIRALIKKLVAAENPRRPLSDNKIADLLKDQGIEIARRTIAKYRDALFIPPSNERKRLV
jgi:RNA polymerase sigma-54 factor